jgi:NitT/TauT family transport system ATP-binding protein
MIKLDKVSQHYENHIKEKTVQAVKDVSFQVKKGEFVCVLGPSGCGKTTLINIIAGFINCYSGEVFFEGQKPQRPWWDRVVVFQEHNLFPWKTVVENVEFGLKAKAISKKNRRETAKNFIDLVNLSGFEDHYPYQLSGGMKQRAALARALAVDPECILMDEPLGSLDAQIRERLQLEISALWLKTKKTVLMVTHDIEEAVFLSERVIVMSNAPGSIKEVVSIDIPHPRKPEVKMSAHFQDIKRSLWKTIME